MPPTRTLRLPPIFCPGNADVGAVDGPAEGGRGFLWDAAIAAGQEVRNYGASWTTRATALPKATWSTSRPSASPPRRTAGGLPHARVSPAGTDPYYHGFDMTIADYWREQEWAGSSMVRRSGKLPALELVRLPHDHLGNFGQALDGVDTPDSQIADQDYALGLIVERLSHSPFWRDTVVIALEDDAQNGSITSTRTGASRSSPAATFVVTPWCHRVYSTPSVLRTIELFWGTAPRATGRLRAADGRCPQR